MPVDRTVSNQPSQHDASRQNCFKSTKSTRCQSTELFFKSTKSTRCQSTELFQINQVNTMPVDRTVSNQPSQHDASRQNCFLNQPSQHDASRQNCFTSTNSTRCQSTELFQINQVNMMPVDSDELWRETSRNPGPSAHDERRVEHTT